MAAVTSDLLVGSYPTLPAQTISVTANATAEDVNLGGRSYYLVDSTVYGADWSLLDRLTAALQSHSQLGLATEVLLQQDLRVRIEFDDDTTLTWPADGILRDLLGFTANLSPAGTSFTAPNVSPLLWSPGRAGTYRARLGTDGAPLHDTAVGASATGIVVSTSHNEKRVNEVGFRYVRNGRIWTVAEAGGEHLAFWQNVLRKSRRFKIYRNTVEDADSTAAITLGTSLPASTHALALVHTPKPPVEYPFAREFQNVESHHPVMIDFSTTPEYRA